MATITEKERIMATYYEAVNRGEKKPIEFIKKLPGYFAGCVYESKWGKVRRDQKWDVFVATAPHICAQYKELPNCLRRILKMQKLKNSFWGDNPKIDGEHIHLPPPLQAAVEDMVVERLDLGEEVTMSYVKRVLDQGVTMWNRVVPHLILNMQVVQLLMHPLYKCWGNLGTYVCRLAYFLFVQKTRPQPRWRPWFQSFKTLALHI